MNLFRHIDQWKRHSSIDRKSSTRRVKVVTRTHAHSFAILTSYLQYVYTRTPGFSKSSCIAHLVVSSWLTNAAMLSL